MRKGDLLFVLGRGGDEVLVSLQIKPLLVGQHVIPNVAAAAKGFLKQLRLGLVRIGPAGS